MKLVAVEQSGGILILDRILSDVSEKDLLKSMNEAIASNWHHFIIDFTPVDFFTSSGASSLVKLSALAKKNRINLVAVGLSQRFQEIFALTGLNAGYNITREKSAVYGYLLSISSRQLDDLFVGNGKQYDVGWAPHIFRLHVAEKPPGAINTNVNQRQVLGPLQGFGPLWEKTYQVKIEKPDLPAYDVMDIMKKRLPEFQPAENTFYPTSRGIAPGEIVLIDSRTPGGIVSTGVLVLYADELSFTLITPQGHPEAGWVTFIARPTSQGVEMQIQGLARASDPFFELAFRVAGAKFQEAIWKKVLTSLASYLKIDAEVTLAKKCLATGLQWGKTGNLWFNSQIRSLPFNLQSLFKRKGL